MSIKLNIMELSDKLLNQIYCVIRNTALPLIDISKAAFYGEDLPEVYANDDILVEYYNGIKEGKTLEEMREICLPKYIRRELNNIA